ncbi:MAG: nucleotidyl transferase AbiEii/AbiGii toxin family protein [Anaerolineaceae bacterium]|nr:nucleotidyl transferase AbiEii/AbiGii toxin family protein [Anaerolineaceae bacterium]MBN2678354.1 nucleotidyl transferase AbiEii/AbiGii toxin family protein [Anaerolineaceae bacterium]
MADLIQSMHNVLAQKDPLLANETRRVILKEFLQAYTLDFLYNHYRYRKLNFYGDTCLHMIYKLNRLSEDIDLDNSPGVGLNDLENDLLTYYRSNIGYSHVTASTQTGEWGVRRTTLKFPLLQALGLSSHDNEALHLKVEVSQHQQISILQKTPVLVYGRSFVAAHFSIETLMAGKMLACLERNFQKGKGAAIKSRDFYDLLWFMQQKIQPLEEKLAKDGRQPYTARSAMQMLGEKIAGLRLADLAADLLPLFEQRSFIEAWLESFKENFQAYQTYYL